MNFNPLPLCALLGFCALASTAQADTITFTDTVRSSFDTTLSLDPDSGSETTERVERVRSFSGDAITLAQFDPTLGSLTRVDLSFTLGDDQRVFRRTSIFCSDDGRFNTACRDADMTVRNYQFRVGIDVVPGRDVFGQLTDELILGRTTSTSYSYDYGEGTAEQRLPLELQDGDGPSQLVYRREEMAPFIGTSDLSFAIFETVGATMTVDCDASIGSSVNRCEADIRSTLSYQVRASLTYTYDPVAPDPSPVPLPAGGWLMLLGLGALALARRRAA